MDKIQILFLRFSSYFLPTLVFKGTELTWKYKKVGRKKHYNDNFVIHI